MRLLVKFLYVFLAVSMLTSCTQRKYGQLTGFQWNKTSKTEKIAGHKGHYVSPKNDIVSTDTSIEDVAWIELSETTEKDIVSSKETSKTTKSAKAVIVKDILFDKTDKKAVNAKKVFTKSNIKEAVIPTKKISKVAKKLKKHTSDDGLLYWILVILLILLLLTLLRKVLGAELYGLLVLIVLILLVLHLLGKV